MNIKVKIKLDDPEKASVFKKIEQKLKDSWFNSAGNTALSTSFQTINKARPEKLDPKLFLVKAKGGKVIPRENTLFLKYLTLEELESILTDLAESCNPPLPKH